MKIRKPKTKTPLPQEARKKIERKPKEVLSLVDEEAVVGED
jgi:hypothetical protein